ncbi:unnamed protein product [Soboliphyme baturini]|uniref:Glyco_trans_4-like_N domain-containing protein n=1 Tax=Soboliphyme baturini TaxID=241478 RepID=A0A183JAY7_9BILA|nr:unnamed protein product [Soboliphyme baturini]
MMGVPTVFTDHSLFGFADASSIIMNKLLQLVLTNASNVICVSHTSKENTVLRADLSPSKVYVIPNAFDCDLFSAPKTRRGGEQINIVIIGRLVYRKGVDLLASVIPEVCNQHPEVNFIIGGDGSKRILLEEMRERHGLQERVTMLGFVPYNYVRNVSFPEYELNTGKFSPSCIVLGTHSRPDFLKYVVDRSILHDYTRGCQLWVSYASQIFRYFVFSVI